VVARCDRARVMGLWAKHCGGMVPQEYMLDFAKVRGEVGFRAEGERSCGRYELVCNSNTSSDVYY
jgi:hypothetical protein